MPEEFHVPAEGVAEYQYWTVPSNFTEDKWVTAAEIKMGDRAVIHHAIVFVYDPKAGPTLPKGLRQNLGNLPQMPRDPSRAKTQQKLGSLLIGSGPGDQAMIMKPGHGMLVKAGAEFIFQIHYTPNGHPTTDRTRCGLSVRHGDAGIRGSQRERVEWPLRNSRQ